MWTPGRQHGWVEDPLGKPASIIRHIIHTVLQFVPGGVIRAGKLSHDDDAHSGFWLGVCADGVARLNLGGPRHSLRWTGETLEIAGWFTTPTVTIDDDGLAIVQGDEMANQLRFVDSLDATLGLLEVTGDWGRWLILQTTQPAAQDEVGRLDLAVDGDLGANVRLRLETTKGLGPASSVAKVMIGNVDRMRLDAAGLLRATGGFDASHARVQHVGDPMEDTDALSRRAADARYPVRAAGWTGEVTWGEHTLTIADGQVVGVT